MTARELDPADFIGYDPDGSQFVTCEVDAWKCAGCDDYVGYWLDDDDESTTRGARWITTYVAEIDGVRSFMCDGCADSSPEPDITVVV